MFITLRCLTTGLPATTASELPTQPKIKLEDPEKLKNVQEELDLLVPCLKVLDLYLDSEEYNSLTAVNSELWELEDEIRLKEQQKNFDWDFITCARQIYMLNDKRAIIKRKINLVTNSHVVEEKSHKEIE